MRAKAIGETLSTGTTLASVGTDVLAVITAVVAADRSGAAMKFSQICKLISRLRLIDINFGKELGTFLDGMGKIFDKSYTVDMETQLKIFLRKLKVTRVYGRGRQRKFDRYAVDMFLFGTMRNNWEDKVIEEAIASAKDIKEIDPDDVRRILRLLNEQKEEVDFSNKSLNLGYVFKELKLWVYMLSFLVKMFMVFQMIKHTHHKYLTEKFLNALKISRKAHFILFNLIAIDIVFIGVRTALHARIIKETKLQYTATVIILGMIFYDIVEIVWMAGSTVYRNKKPEGEGSEKELGLQN